VAGVLELTLEAAVVVFMVGSLLAMGLAVSPGSALAPLGDTSFVALTLVSGWLVCPAVAAGLLYLVPLERPYAVGLVLLSLAPAAPFAPVLMQRARADPAYSCAYMILGSIGTVALMPPALPMLIRGVSTDAWTIARPLLLFLLLPLMVGLALRSVQPGVAARMRPWASRIGNAAGIVLLVLVAVRYADDMWSAVGSYAIATQVAFVAAITGITHLLGAGLQPRQRSVLTVGTCSRNLGAALAAVPSIERDPRALVMIAIGAPVTLLATALVARWLRAGPSASDPASDGAEIA
jgi:BASS family bile acid:Na+ symporter